MVLTLRDNRNTIVILGKVCTISRGSKVINTGWFDKKTVNVISINNIDLLYNDKRLFDEDYTSIIKSIKLYLQNN